MSSMRRAFVTCSWKSVWYFLRCMKMVRNIYVLWDMVFAICIGSMYRYFVGKMICKVKSCNVCLLWDFCKRNGEVDV